ncbi:MAG TPA: hypothetical protein VLM79_14165 [Kofleriaceae bacterium]|nr:hypothetical protein [Kofleriaceae bacterium]
MALSRDENAVVDREVRDLLARSRAFGSLPPREREQLVERTTRIASRMIAHELGAPVAQTAHAPARSQARVPDDPYALALDDPSSGFPFSPPGTAPPASGTPTPDDKWRPDERFRAEGIAAGVTQAARLVKEVDFPAFVASLVKGTFQAVVDASIQQMDAYGKLVQQVAQSLNDFADDHVGDEEGQKKLISKYPNIFEMAPDKKSGTAKLQVKDDFDSDSMPDFTAELGLEEPVTDIDEDSLPKLVTAAKLEIARGRQQLLATTILMGINRIIVTDGKINAKIKFDFTATDSMTRDGRVSDYDTSQKIVQDYDVGIGDRYVKGHFERPVPIQVSSTTGHTDATIDATAKLSGEVSLNFRSETFPLERMVNTDQMLQLNRAQSGVRGAPAPAAAPAVGAPAPAAAPAPAPAKGP